MKTTKPANTFCSDLFVPRADGYAVVGDTVKAVCLMTGAHAATADESAAKAVETAGDERGYAHHPIVYVIVQELCGCCGGNGKVQKMRSKRPVPYAWGECKACEGAGSWYAGKTVTVLNS